MFQVVSLLSLCLFLSPYADTQATQATLAGPRANLGGVYVEIEPITKQVEFLVEKNGLDHYFIPVHEGSVIAEKRGFGHSLLFEGVEIGQIRDEKLLLCEGYQIEGKKIVFPCSAIFYDGQQAPFSNLQAKEIDEYYVDISLASPRVEGSNSPTDKTVSLASHAQKQIEQHGTGTCAYNAATGIVEMLFSIETGEAVDLSEP